ncbi:MAG TPA: glutamine synthetase family protein [Actinomycetes bacterium]|nr:glutamine synthetase family protein [Actinomycetes bacterium]
MTTFAEPQVAGGELATDYLDVPLEQAIDRGWVHEVEVAWPDQGGHVLGKRIPARRFLGHVAAGGFTFCDAALAWNLVGEVVDDARLSNASTGYPDAFAVPDLSTARPLPWRKRTIQVIADVVDHHGQPVRTSPREVLRRVVGRLAELGFSARVGVELEFFLLQADGTLPPQLLQCYSLEKANELDPALEQIVDTVHGFVPLEGVHTEYAPAQVELNLHHAEAVTAADDAFRLRYAVREAARRAGQLATFMAKPFSEWSGSSQHLHVSLWRDGKPAFASDDLVEPAAARHAIGGLLAHLPGITVFGAPTVNSYKRYTVASFAPTTASWSGDNRTGAVRSLIEAPEATRIELRTPAADANPYWAVAAALAAVVAGLESAAEPPSRRAGDLYAGGGPPLPATLGEAVDAARADSRIAEILGEDAVHDFLVLAESEWSAYSREVTQWERDRYLRNR